MQRGEFKAVSGWHRTGTPGCYESDDYKAGVEKMYKKNRWKLWLYVGPHRWQFWCAGMYSTRNEAMKAYKPKEVHGYREGGQP